MTDLTDATLTLHSNLGAAQFTAGGTLRRFDVAGLSLLQYPANSLQDGLAGLWLRVESADGSRALPLVGAASGARATLSGSSVLVEGESAGLEWRIEFRFGLNEASWYWHLTVRNLRGDAARLSCVWATDPALTPYEGLRINECYVAQYLDVSPIDTPAGPVLAVRQNMPGEQQPWVLLGSTSPTAGWATDALQVTRRVAGRPSLDLTSRLPGRRLQHEHTWAGLETQSVVLEPDGMWSTTFYGLLVPDHPDATGPQDLALIEVALNDPHAAPTEIGGRVSEDAPEPPTAEGTSLFASVPVLEVDELSPADLEPYVGSGVHLLEQDATGWLAYVTDAGEAVTSAAKERIVLRPHGHIMRTGTALLPSTSSLTATVYQAGQFAAQLTEGHVARGNALSGTRTYLGLLPAQGTRGFVQTPEGWRRLEVPSAWAVTATCARWFYATPEWLLEVSTAAENGHRLRVSVRTLRGRAPRFLLAAHIALGPDDGQADSAVQVERDLNVASASQEARSIRFEWLGDAVCGDDAPLFSDGRSRGLPWITWETNDDLDVTIRCSLVPEDQRIPEPTSGGAIAPPSIALPGRSHPGVESLAAILPWFMQNATIHYLSPRGLEQFTGGAWGTRDVSQGPVGLLSALDEQTALRDVLIRIMAGQNERGDWPQAFDFLPPASYWHQLSSHGDVVGWPLLAVGDYLAATEDASLLRQRVPFVSEDQKPSQPHEFLTHLERAVDFILASTVGSTALPAYGNGDWNDSLQPADPHLARSMTSAWTSVLFVQALRALADGLMSAAPTEPDAAALAARCVAHADAVAADLRRLLLVDGVLAGYGVFADGGSAPERLLVHPADSVTGLTYGVLPWIHAITADLLEPAEAADHLRLLREHLLGPDGARLFDRPTAYRGGPMNVFKRAEAATFWGREIGLMYTHAHLRYAEALARFGDAEGLYQALLLACPFGLTDRLPQARARQSTCYYSSSDAVFVDRLDAEERYRDLMTGQIEFEGGWRVYSSGPGLFLRLVVQCLLGLRRRGHDLEVDPVLPRGLDGLVARVPLDGRELEFEFKFAPIDRVQVSAGGHDIVGRALTNPFRAAGVRVRLGDLGPGTIQVRMPTVS